MDSQRIRQTVIGVLILVGIAVFWNRGGSSPDAVPPVTPPASEVVQAPVPAETSAPSPAAAVAPSNADAAFDYYLLVLSWSPTHCSSDQGRGRDDDLQCRSGRPYGFVLHGLWPQHERGYPQDCPSDEPRVVDDGVLAKVLKISPSEQLVQHEWRKHGTCSGMRQADYFAAAASAFASITVPSIYDEPKAVLSTTPDDVRDAFLAANPSLSYESVSATCRRNDLAEVWVCLDKRLSPRACSKDVRDRHCGGRKVRMRAVRGDWPR
jgi:ribonuclease T2